MTKYYNVDGTRYILEDAKIIYKGYHDTNNFNAFYFNPLMAALYECAPFKPYTLNDVFKETYASQLGQLIPSKGKKP